MNHPRIWIWMQTVLDKTPTAHIFFTSLLGLISFRVVQIWYCSLDIRHTVGELADTQQHSVPVLSLQQILSRLGPSCNTSSNWLHPHWWQIHTVVSFRLHPSCPHCLNIIPKHHGPVVLYSGHTLGLYIYRSVFSQVFVGIGWSLFWWVRTNR